MEQEPPKRKKKAKRRANRAALEQKRQEIEMETFKEFASTVTADYLAEMCRFEEFYLFLCYQVSVLNHVTVLNQVSVLNRVTTCFFM